MLHKRDDQSLSVWKTCKRNTFQHHMQFSLTQNLIFLFVCCNFVVNYFLCDVHWWATTWKPLTGELNSTNDPHVLLRKPRVPLSVPQWDSQHFCHNVAHNTSETAQEQVEKRSKEGNKKGHKSKATIQWNIQDAPEQVWSTEAAQRSSQEVKDFLPVSPYQAPQVTLKCPSTNRSQLSGGKRGTLTTLG